MFSQVDHIGIAVADLAVAKALYGDTFGMPLVHEETLIDFGVRIALFDIGGSHIELLSPLDDDTPVSRFLDKQGPGLHHVAYRVPDVEKTLDRLRGSGIKLIDDRPRRGIRGSRVAFLHPKSVGGVLTEIVEYP